MHRVPGEHPSSNILYHRVRQDHGASRQNDRGYENQSRGCGSSMDGALFLLVYMVGHWLIWATVGFSVAGAFKIACEIEVQKSRSRKPWYDIDIDKGVMRDIEEVQSRWCRLPKWGRLSC